MSDELAELFPDRFPAWPGRPVFASAEEEARAIFGDHLDVPKCPNCGVAAAVETWGEEPMTFDGSVVRYPLQVYPIAHLYPASVEPTSQHDVCDGPSEPGEEAKP